MAASRRARARRVKDQRERICRPMRANGLFNLQNQFRSEAEELHNAAT